jgi:hypothetical protein
MLVPTLTKCPLSNGPAFEASLPAREEGPSRFYRSVGLTGIHRFNPDFMEHRE